MKKNILAAITVIALCIIFLCGCENKDQKEIPTETSIELPNEITEKLPEETPVTSEYIEIEPLVGTPLDYSNSENWMFFDNNDEFEHDVDVFYLYPTCSSAEIQTVVAEVDDYMKNEAKISYLKSASAFSDYCNIYVPYYRQISKNTVLQSSTADEIMELCRQNVTRTDVFSALDFYFDYCNEGKPFILAGHSQGSCNLKLVLSEYMRVHPEYLERMVACYAIGYYFPETWFEENNHIKKAQGEEDFGVLVNWNTEAPNGEKYNLLLGNNDGYCINPLNWKTDETPAGIEENKGSAKVDETTLELTIVEGLADACIDKERGVVICSTYSNTIPDNNLFGDKSLHFDDWSLYYNNIKENAEKRIINYKIANG